MNEFLPPTVPVPLAVLLEDSGLGLRQLAGPREDTGVHSVHTSEMEDPVPYLLGGELLLSAGVKSPPGGSAETADSYWDRYVARTVEAGAAALGFGVAPVHDAVPEALVAAADRYGLPLLEVPRRTPFTAVARAMWQAMAERRHRELRRMSEAQQSLAGAAARPHPVPAVLGQLAQHLSGWAVLLDQDGAELAAAGPRPSEPVRTALASLAGRLRPGPSSAAGAEGDVQLTVYGLPGPPASGEGRLALGVCAPARGAAGSAIAAVAVVLLSLLTGARTAGAGADRSAALVRLLLGAAPADVTHLLGGAATGRATAGPGSEGSDRRGEPDLHDPGERWTVVHGRRRGPQGTDGPLAVSALAAGLGTSLLDLDGDQLRALVPGSRPIEAQPGWTLGAGAPVPPQELARGDTDAARALRRAFAERAPLVRDRAGSGAGVSSLVVPEEARELAGTRLAPISGSPALVETLRAWLSLHGSWDRTAVALEVHRNTVRQRVARIAELLDADLNDPEVRMELWFALKWL